MNDILNMQMQDALLNPDPNKALIGIEDLYTDEEEPPK